MAGVPPQENWIDQALDWLENLDIPEMTFWQKALVAFQIIIVFIVVIATFTGDAGVVAEKFAHALSPFEFGYLTVIIVVIVAILAVIGVNTTVMALALGFIYGQRFDGVLIATLVASAVCFVVNYVAGFTPPLSLSCLAQEVAFVVNCVAGCRCWLSCGICLG